MNTKERLLTAWKFQEPDRVPLEMFLSPSAQGLPGADAILDFQKNEADNFLGVHGFDWGFLGLDATYREEVIEDVPGQFTRKRRIHTTAVGEFTAVTKHTYEDLHGEGDPGDFHWERRYVETLDDLQRLVKADRQRRPFRLAEYNRGCADIGVRGVPITGLFHPLGLLVRNSNIEEVYLWMLSEPELMEAFLACCTEQVCDSIQAIKGAALADPLVFKTHALEMFIPPWLGQEQFRKWIFPYDQQVNDAIHAIGGRHFAHCHGNSGAFLERFADMGIDAVDPLEPPPYGDNILADAKQRVGRRMLLCGNIPSQLFPMESTTMKEIRELVKQAIEDGAPGGGFTLRTTGSAHVGNGKTNAQKIKSIECGLAIIDAWREFGKY
ncbi:MAG: hypothetical protein K9N49_06780 [Candidatus Marinimicrobia bacterium]|nr:hypothetical protein [Candidatus Neomarinimicrobiota bacterium]